VRTRVRALRSDALVGLEQWAPKTAEDFLTLVDALVEHTGCSRHQAAGCAEWLTRRVVRRDDRTSNPTRAAYRRLLRCLEEAGVSSGDLFRDSFILAA